MFRYPAAVFAIFGSLITFPSGIPWVIAFWIGCFLATSMYGSRGWLPLTILVAILVVKRLNWTLSLLELMATCIGIAIFRYRMPERDLKYGLSGVINASSVILICFAVWFSTERYFEATSSMNQREIDPARPVVCLGDSLTAAGYPQELAKLITTPVIDFGRDGINSKQAFELLQKIAAENPQLVVIKIGGHDYNQRDSREDLRVNLERLILHCRESDARVVIVEIPRGFITDPFAGIERELAGKFDLQLVSDYTIRQFVFWSPICPPGSWLDNSQHLSRDGLHPNEHGNRFLAEQVAHAVSKVLGHEVVPMH